MAIDVNIKDIDASSRALPRKTPGSKVDIQVLFPLLGLVLVALIFQIASGGRLLSSGNLKTVINEAFVIMIGTTGYIFLVSQGNLDFSIGASMAVCSSIAVLAADVHPLLALPIGILVGAAIGGVNGFVVVKLGVSSFIATIAMQLVLQGFVQILLNDSVRQAPLAMMKYDTLPIKITVLAFILLIGCIAFEYTAYGKRCRAIGSCAEAARQTGVSMFLTRFLPFVLMGGLVGVLSFFSLARTTTASPQTGSELFTSVLIAVLLGGVPISGGASSRFRAVLIGGITVALLTNGMTLLGFVPNDKQLIKGLVFVAAIAVSFDRKNMKVIK